jgi:hypothetical protein
MKKIFSLLFAIVFLLSFVSLFSLKALAACDTTCNNGYNSSTCPDGIHFPTYCGLDPMDSTKDCYTCSTSSTPAAPSSLSTLPLCNVKASLVHFYWYGDDIATYYYLQWNGNPKIRINKGDSKYNYSGNAYRYFDNPNCATHDTTHGCDLPYGGGPYAWSVQACNGDDTHCSTTQGTSFTALDLNSDSKNCGICNNSCNSDQTCSGGSCVDASPTCTIGGGSFCGGPNVNNANSDTLYWCTDAGSAPQYSYNCSGGCNPNGEDGNAYCNGQYLCTGGIDSSWNFCGSNGKNQNIITSNAIDSTLYNCPSSTNGYTVATGQACAYGCSSNALGDGTCNSAPQSGNPGGDNPSCTVTWTGTPATVSQGSSFQVIVVPGTGGAWANEKLYLDGAQVTSNATWAKYPDLQTGPDDSWTFSNPGTVGSHTLKFNNGTTDCAQTFNYTVNAATTLSLTIGLDGVGKTGDLANKNPLADADIVAPVVTTARAVHVDVLDSSGAVKGSGDGTISYQSTGDSKGLFKGDVSVAALTAGTYTVKVKVEEHISNTLTNQTITAAGPNIITTIPNAEAGDVAWNTGTVPDDQLTASDYSAITGCMPNFTTADKTACTIEVAKRADLNLDGTVDQLDYNLFLREYNARKNGSS